LLVPPNDVAAMTNAIRRILTEPALAERLSSRAHRKASQFDWQTITPQWDRLLLGAIQGRLIATENDLAPAISAELPERPREFVEVTPAASRQIV
jgi:hypothetical protein